MRTFIVIISVLFGALQSCTVNKDETSLNADEIDFIQELRILEEEEVIEMFESNAGFKGIEQSGNFITKKRIASYWIEDDQKEIESAFFSNEIDSITLTDLVSKPTYASYLTVYRSNGSTFKVYVDADSTRTYQFYEKAVSNLRDYRVSE